MTEGISPQLETSETPYLPVERAGLPSRFAALFIDLILLSLVGSCLSIPGRTISALGGPDWMSALPGLLGLLITGLYFMRAYSTGGQTLGKRALSIKVVSVDGSPLNWRKGIARTFGYLLSWIPFGLGFLWAIWDADKQAGHDKIAGTCVVPVSVTPEALQGSVDPAEVRRRQRRFLLGLGIPSLLILGWSFSTFLALVQRGVAETRAMEPWPGSLVSVEEAVGVDLSPLGLQAEQVQDARDEKTWSGGGYQDGTMATYSSGGQPVVAVWALRYADKQAAAADFAATQGWAEGNCGRYSTAFWGDSGVIHCQSNGVYNKTFWNEDWIVDIVALDGSGTEAALLVDQVRDALAAHWKELKPAP